MTLLKAVLKALSDSRPSDRAIARHHHPPSRRETTEAVASDYITA